jgi:ankyrin repeat protein
MDLVDYLLEHDSSVETVNSGDWQTGQTALYWAVKHGAMDVVARLVELGAELNRRDLDWQTVFTVAVMARHYHIITFLVRDTKTQTLF